MSAQLEKRGVDLADALRTVAVNSAYSASRALSKWFKHGVRLTCDGFAGVPIAQASELAGAPDDPVVAVHMTLQGDLHGDVLLVFPENVAYELVDLMIGAAPGTTRSLGELEISCLQETGNIVGTSFANCLSSWLNVTTIPASPTVVHDMACAVIDPLVIGHAAVSDEALVSKTEFDMDGHRKEWSLLLLPSAESMKRMERQCRGDHVRRNALHAIAINGAFGASRAMSKWLKRGVRLHTEGFVRIPLRDIGGNGDDNTEPVAAILMDLASQLHGHALLVMPESTGRRLVDVLTHQPPGTTQAIDEMARSCLQETGNIISSSFINSWAKWLDIHAEPQPPRIQIDLLPAILQSVLVEQALAADEIFLAKTSFSVDGQWLDWEFYLLPTPSSLRLIEASLA